MKALYSTQTCLKARKRMFLVFVITDQRCDLRGDNLFLLPERRRRRRRGHQREPGGREGWGGRKERKQVADERVSTTEPSPPSAPTVLAYFFSPLLTHSNDSALHSISPSASSLSARTSKPSSLAPPCLVLFCISLARHLLQRLSSLLKIDSELAHYLESFAQLNSQTPTDSQWEISCFP